MYIQTTTKHSLCLDNVGSAIETSDSISLNFSSERNKPRFVTYIKDLSLIYLVHNWKFDQLFNLSSKPCMVHEENIGRVCTSFEVFSWLIWHALNVVYRVFETGFDLVQCNGNNTSKHKGLILPEIDAIHGYVVNDIIRYLFLQMLFPWCWYGVWKATVVTGVGLHRTRHRCSWDRTCYR